MLGLLPYLRTLLAHKAWILGYGLSVNWQLRFAWPVRVSVSRLLLHDWVKFLPVELFPYARQFFPASGGDPAAYSEDFLRAFAHHWRRMDHHHEHHIDGYHAKMSKEEMKARARPMPVEAVVEV
jgi:hypothetical protein